MLEPLSEGLTSKKKKKLKVIELTLPSEEELDKLGPPKNHVMSMYERLVTSGRHAARSEFEKATVDNAHFIVLTAPYGLDRLRQWMERKDYLADRRGDLEPEESWI